MYRRTRSLANYEHANKKLETAKNKGKGVHEAEAHQQTCKEKFDKLSEVGKEGESSLFGFSVVVKEICSLQCV